MKFRLACIAIGLMFATSASAANWKKVSEESGGVHYVDTQSIKKVGDYLEATNITDYPTRGKYGELSTRAVSHYKCRTQLFAVLGMEDFSEKGAKGKVINEYFELPTPMFKVVLQGSAAADMLREVCKRSK